MNIFTEHISGFGTTAIDDDGEEAFEEFTYEPPRRVAEEAEDRYEASIQRKIAALFSESAEAWNNHFRSKTEILNSMFASTLPAFNDAVYDSVFRSNSILDALLDREDGRMKRMTDRINADLIQSVMAMPPDMPHRGILNEILNSPPKSATEVAAMGREGATWDGNEWIWSESFPNNSTIIMRNSNPPRGQSLNFSMLDQVDHNEPWPDDGAPDAVIMAAAPSRATYAMWRNAAQVAPPFNGLAAMRRLFDEVSGNTKTPRQEVLKETMFREGIMYQRSSREDAWTPIVPNAGVRSLLDGITSSPAVTGAIRSM